MRPARESPPTTRKVRDENLQAAQGLDLLGRYVGSQFEDDLNTLALDSFFVVDLSVSREVRPGWEVFLGVENLLGETYEVGKTAEGLVTIGAPALARLGLRVRPQRAALP